MEPMVLALTTQVVLHHKSLMIYKHTKQCKKKISDKRML